MTRKAIAAFAIAVLVASSAVVLAQEAGELVEVTVTGESAHSFEAAKEDALRRAVEAGAGKTVFSDTHVSNFRLMHDTIVSRAAGYVKSYDVLSRDEADGVYSMRVRAVVAVGSIDEDWGALQILLRRKGNPTLLVVVEETVDGMVRSDRPSEYRLRDIFDELGFDLIDDEALAGIGERDALRASLVGDERRAASVAAQLHATYAVTGRADVRTGNERRVGGVDLLPANADLNLKIVAADNAYLVASKSFSSRRTAREAGTAVKTALEDAAAGVAQAAIPRMLEHWARDIDEGTVVTLVGTRVDTGVLQALIERLRGLDGVTTANVQDHNREMTTVNLRTRLEASSLSKELESLSGGRLAVTGFSPGRVEFAMKSDERRLDTIEKAAPPGAEITPERRDEIASRVQPRPAGSGGPGGVTLSTPVLVLGAVVVVLLGVIIGLIVARRR
ncbi:MAG: hypothetical protein J7M19_06715 [Planctomycetes bacterium]|nr:hypothetical protein [Planctomycetota bacterium]